MYIHYKCYILLVFHLPEQAQLEITSFKESVAGRLYVFKYIFDTNRFKVKTVLKQSLTYLTERADFDLFDWKSRLNIFDLSFYQHYFGKSKILSPKICFVHMTLVCYSSDLSEL